jgi:curli production assembly/transport component CsgG
MLQKLLFLSVISLSSCATFDKTALENIPTAKNPKVSTLIVEDLWNCPPPTQKPVVAVYSGTFKDDTGQRRSNSAFATFSTAVTQAPDVYLIRALKHACAQNQGFFEVIERIGLDAITKERQIIRSTREQFEEDYKLKPLMFAGLIMQGSVVGYESNVKSGGIGARYLGIGSSQEYRQDTVVVSLRTVSVSTGRILLEVLVTKTILSVSNSQDVFKFVANGTELIEIEKGKVENESVNIALQAAIETAVLQTINEGRLANFWSIKDED